MNERQRRSYSSIVNNSPKYREKEKVTVRRCEKEKKVNKWDFLGHAETPFALDSLTTQTVPGGGVKVDAVNGKPMTECWRWTITREGMKVKGWMCVCECLLVFCKGDSASEEKCIMTQ